MCNDRSKITLIIGASSTLSSFSRMGRMLSRPAALPGLKLFSSFKIPFIDMTRLRGCSITMLFRKLSHLVDW